MNDQQLMDLLAPLNKGIENTSKYIREDNTELFINKKKRILDLLYVITRDDSSQIVIDIKCKSTKEKFIAIRSVQYCTAILTKTEFTREKLPKILTIWINMAPSNTDEGTILVNPPLMLDQISNTYRSWEALLACPKIILVNLYDIRKNREKSIEVEKSDVIAILSTIFSRTIAYDKKLAILKERGFQLDDEINEEMKDMESWSESIFESIYESMKDDMMRKAWEEALAEAREKVMKASQEEVMKAYQEEVKKRYNDILLMVAEGKLMRKFVRFILIIQPKMQKKCVRS